MEIDSQLSQLLGTLSLDGQRRKSTFVSFISSHIRLRCQNDLMPMLFWRKESEEPLLAQTSQTRPIVDAAMSDSSDSEDSTYQVRSSRFP